MKKIFIRTPYNYDTDQASNETALFCPPEESKTQQHQAEEADINNIVARFGLTGVLPENIRAPQYGDFTQIGTYQEALNAVMAAHDSFMALPAAVRERFKNDPAEFVDFCADESNREEAEKMGLLIKPEPVPLVRIQEQILDPKSLNKEGKKEKGDNE